MKRRALGVLIFASGALLLLTASVKFLPKEIEFESISTVEAAEQKYPPIHVRIPEVQIDVAVKNARVVRGKWEVFETVAAYGLGSGFPGEVGNVVISAHARKELFLPLKKVEKDMFVFLLTENAEYEYKIVDIKEVLPNDISVIAQTDDETLTLYTCIGITDSKRLVVVAKRIVEESLTN